MKKNLPEKSVGTHIPELAEKLNLLFIEPDADLIDSVESLLESKFNLIQAIDLRQASDILSKIDIQIVVCEEKLVDGSGIEFLAKLKISHPNIVRIISSSSNDATAALKAVNNASIFKYLLKPWDDTILGTLEDGVQYFRTEISLRTI